MRRWMWGLLGIAGIVSLGLNWRGGGRSSPRTRPGLENAPPAASNTNPRRIALGEPSITPPGALAGEHQFSAEAVRFKDARLGGFKPAGPVYKFGPSGRTFHQPVTITVPYDPRMASKGAALTLWTRAESETSWSKVGNAVVDEQRNVLVAQVQHFSLFTAGQACIDLDGDGYSPCTGDCDETNPNINPGADEICYDRIDQNCNGILDEGCASEW